MILINRVKQLICNILIFGLLLFAPAFLPMVAAQSTVLNSKEIEARLNSYLSPYLDQKDFSGVALIAAGDSIQAQRSFGFANAQNRVKNNLDTKFRVASLSKTFTAAAIIILRDQGKLKLNERLSKFYPDFPNGQNIMIEHLLLHQSGVGTLEPLKNRRDCYSADQLVEEIGKIKPYFAPGTAGSYSNEGYNLLAAVIEKVSGETYESFLQKNIFQPLGMKNSGSFCSEAKLENLATGHVPGSSVKTIEAVPFNQLVQIGSGSIYSTAPDLLKWLKAVNESRFFNIEKLRYPYGWGPREYTGNKLIEQSGIVEGFNAYMALFPAEKIYVVFLSNIQSGLFNRVPRDLKAVAFGGEFSTPPIVTAKRSDIELADYAGAYRTPNIPVPLNVISEKGRLYLRWGNDAFRRSLTPIAKDKFFFRVEYAEISFERNGAGEIEKIKWQSGTGDPFFLNRVERK
jgi:CubicO group peptidase (beta-lactamase class C family)